MRINLLIICLASIVCLLGCKKNSADISETIISETINDLDQSLVYRTEATIPSPADFAKGRLKDSIAVFRKINLSEPHAFTNITHVESATRSGFGLSYIDPNKSAPYFIVSYQALSTVPREFQLNKKYESFVQIESFSPVFLGASNAFDAMTYFVNNALPPDADYPPMSRTYTSVVFTKKFKVLIRPYKVDTALFASGHIVGYRIDYWKKSDTSKYKQRWDFSINFTDLKIDK